MLFIYVRLLTHVKTAMKPLMYPSPVAGSKTSVMSRVFTAGHRIIKGAQATANNKQNKEKQMALFTRDEVLTQLQQGKSFYQAELSQINLQGANNAQGLTREQKQWLKHNGALNVPI